MGLYAEGAATLLVRIFTLGSGFLIVTRLTRWLGPEGYGVYALGVSVMMVLSVLIHLGIPTLLTREIAASLAREDRHNARYLEAFSLKLILLMGFAVGTVFIFILKLGLHDSFLMIAAPFGWIIALNATVYALQQRSMAILSGRKEQLLSQIPDGVVRPVAMLAILAFITIYDLQNVGAALGAFLTANLLSLLVATCLVARVKPVQPKAGVPSRLYDVRVRHIAPFTLLGLIGVAQANADTIILASFLPIKEVSIYKVAAFMGSIPSNIHAVVVGLLLPRAAGAWAMGQRDFLENMSVRASRSAFIFALAYAVTVWLFGRSIIGMAFGAAYTDVYPLACLMVIPPILITAVGSSFSVLNMCHQAHTSSQIAAVALVIAVLGMAVGAAIFGTVGAAWVSILSAAFLSFASWLAVKRKVGVRCDIFLSVSPASNMQRPSCGPEIHKR
ncbi:MAG: oligosaccharide flippase family protein [Betaproteobacteria bacterium]